MAGVTLKELEKNTDLVCRRATCICKRKNCPYCFLRETHGCDSCFDPINGFEVCQDCYITKT